MVTDLILNVAILFIMMIPGVILKKCKLCPEGFGKGVSNLVLYIAQPCLIVYAYLSCDVSFSEIWVGCLMTLILSIIAHCIFVAVAMPIFRKAEDAACRMLRFATIFSNAAFMGIPLIQAVVPDPTAAIYASIYNITFNLFLWTLGVRLCTEGHVVLDTNDGCDCDEKVHEMANTSILKVLIHPVTLASFIGLALLIFGVSNSTLYNTNLGIISDSLLMMKNLVAPLSMVVIGLRLADISFKGFLGDIYMYVFLALRHIALPVIVVLVIKLLAMLSVPINNTVALVIAIMASAPAASSATMFAEKYDCDAMYVSRLVAVSTILCIATMPLIVLVAG